MRFLLRVVALAGLPPLVPFLCAQEPSCQQRVFPVSVTDRNASPIRDLTPADFRAEFRGQAVKILSLTADTRPHRIVIVLDASGSMNGPTEQGKWDLARALASHPARTRMPNTGLALLIFNEKVVEQVDFSQGADAIGERLLQIKSDTAFAKQKVAGRTALLDAILSALRLMDQPGSADIIYVITDGGENSSRTDRKGAQRALLSAGVRLYASLLASDPSYGQTPEELNGIRQLSELIGATGGGTFGPIGYTPSRYVRYALSEREQANLSLALIRLYQLMLENYLVEVELPQPVDKWRNWKLELSKEKRRQFKDADVSYPRELAPCRQ